MGRLGAIVLAAGGSTRLGRPKQLLVYQGQTLLERSVDAVRQTGCDEVVVVLGGAAAGCQAHLGDQVFTVINADWKRGMGSSLRLGAAHLSEKVDRAFIVLCDQPFITASILNQFLSRMNASYADACVSTFDSTAGPPVLINRTLIDRLKDWPDEEGAKRLWTNPDLRIERINVPEAATDIDTEADVTRILERNQ